MADLRTGLKSTHILRRETREAIGRAEQAAAAMLRDPKAVFRRIGDPAGTTRQVDRATVRVKEWLGLVVSVRGYVRGERDRGLDCNDCPLSDLLEVSRG